MCFVISHLPLFGMQETSDSWVDALQLWWTYGRKRFAHIKKLVIYLDNGPHNNGTRTQFLKRMVEFADWSGLTIHLAYYPPYHSKYNPVERCWSALSRKWSGVLLNCASFVLECARRTTWKGERRGSSQLPNREHLTGVKLSKPQMRLWEARLQRKPGLGKYDILIKPRPVSS